MPRTFHLSEEYFKRLKTLTLTYTVPLLLLGVPAISYFEGRARSQSQTSTFVSWLLSSAIIAFSLYVALRRQVKLWRTFQLTVDEESVSRTQEAHAPVVIRASEIQQIREAPRRGLTVVTQHGGVALSIPETLADYSECRARLARWAPIQTVRGPLNRVLLLATAFVFMGAYVLFNRMRDPSAIVLLGVPLAGLFIFSHVGLMRSPDVDQRTKRFAWLAAVPVLQIAGRIITAIQAGR